MLDDIDFKGATLSLGDHAPPRLSIQNIDVSVRPESRRADSDALAKNGFTPYASGDGFEKKSSPQ